MPGRGRGGVGAGRSSISGAAADDSSAAPKKIPKWKI